MPVESLDLLNAVDLGALSFQESVLDNPAINTRAGLYVYLNALVSTDRVPLRMPFKWDYLLYAAVDSRSFSHDLCLMISWRLIFLICDIRLGQDILPFTWYH